VTFDKTSKTYANLDLQVRALPEDHDTGDLMAALGEAERTETPALGLFYQEERPTLGEAMNVIIRKAGDDVSSGTGSRKIGVPGPGNRITFFGARDGIPRPNDKSRS
jgi:hypothetical protein